MDDKEKNVYGGSGRYQQNKQGYKKNYKDPNEPKPSLIPSGVDSTGLNFINVSCH